MAITQEIYTDLQKAYDFFNEKLFGNELPEAVITLSGEARKAYGYFRHQCFHDETKNAEGNTPDAAPTWDEIALNPFQMRGRTNEETLSTLVHEMVHLWQHHFGKPKKVHHDKQWAFKMEELGLMPSSTGAEGGKRTGMRVSHYIIDGGLYSEVVKDVPVTVDFSAFKMTLSGKTGKKYYFKYECPECEATARAKKDANLICGSCNVKMEKEEGDDDE